MSIEVNERDDIEDVCPGLINGVCVRTGMMCSGIVTTGSSSCLTGLDLLDGEDHIVVYFAHSVTDYDTDYEKECISKIKNKFQHINIVNPKDIVMSDEDKNELMGKYESFIVMMRKHYSPAIDKCDIFCPFVSNKTNRYTHGVFLEIEYAHTIGKVVLELGDE